MDILIDGHKVRLKQKDVIGSGGEGIVYKTRVKNEDLAVKIYHQPNKERGNKLKAFIAKSWNLPLAKVARPLYFASDLTGQNILGPAMPYLGIGFEEMTSLANKKYRASFLISTKTVSDIFIDGWSTVDLIHKNGLIIGDYNDMNALFRLPREKIFIDVDAWQFDNFPCPVGTEQFLAPELYGIDLSLRPVFEANHDWYSFAVMLFKSLLYVHPFGGTHKDVNLLTKRVARRITVLDPQVKYPKIALSPDLLSDDLAEVFDKFFAKGWRGKFPLDQLQLYQDSLVECKNCKTYYPRSRKQCPACTQATIMIITKPSMVNKGVNVVELLRTKGPIVFNKLISNNLFVIAYENGKAVLYIKYGNLPVVRRELFNQIAGARYEMMDNILVVNMPNTTEILLLDISGDTPKPVLRTETNVFALNRRAMFRTSDHYLFRIVGGSLLYGEIQNGHLIERSLRTAMDEQTWFTVRPQQTGSKPSAFGFFQMGSQQLFWLVWDGQIFDTLPISSMETGESMSDLVVRFSSQGVLIRRLTQFQGTNYIRTDIVGTDGKIVLSSPRVREEDHPTSFTHGQAYSSGKLLHATDEGIVQEDVIGNSLKEFESTKGHVIQGDKLYPYQNGLLVVKDTSVVQVTLG